MRGKTKKRGDGRYTVEGHVKSEDLEEHQIV